MRIFKNIKRYVIYNKLKIINWKQNWKDYKKQFKGSLKVKILKTVFYKLNLQKYVVVKKIKILKKDFIIKMKIL